jgi:hypothetical protein
VIKTSALPDLFSWSRFQPDRGIDFNAFLVCGPDGNLLVDPLPLDAHELEDIRSRGGARWILLTNFDHLRDAPALRRLFEARLLAPAGDRERFGESAALVDGWLEGDDSLPEGLSGRISLWPLRGGKSPIELALHLRPQRALLFGDLVRSQVSGRLCLLPPAKIADPRAVKQSLLPLSALDFDAVLLGDGDSLHRDGKRAFAELLEALP